MRSWDLKRFSSKKRNCMLFAVELLEFFDEKTLIK